MNGHKRHPLLALAAVITVVLMFSVAVPGHSVFTHEEIVDLAWTSELRPLLLHRFPSLTEDQIKEAHAYAYGGSVIQDLGYYPFGSRQFSDLVHYVRTLRYPKLRAKCGKSVRYAQDRTAHLKTEFGFDTLQVAKDRYPSDQYHDFIGFKVAQPLLERSFEVV